jgi:hypothetical protein
MGYTTDFVGHIDVHPALNREEIEYLTAFSQSRRYERPGGPYAVPGNPRAEEPPVEVDDSYNRPAPGQPQLWCQWVPCWEGCCLSVDGREKFYRPVAWLRYLVDHFLKPGAEASFSGDPQFEHFTFDHAVAGMVVGCRRDNKELFAIEASGDRVNTKILRPGDPDYFGMPPLPYEAELDRVSAERPRRRRPRRQRAGLSVVNLADRRAET